jgi:hypothetical protein
MLARSDTKDNDELICYVQAFDSIIITVDYKVTLICSFCNNATGEAIMGK